DHPQFGRGQRVPAAAGPVAWTARAAPPFDGVLHAHPRALSARRLVALLAERLAQPRFELDPVLLLEGHAHDAELRACRVGRGAKPRRVVVGAESRPDLRESVETAGNV